MTTRCMFALLAVLSATHLAYGKGPPDLIVISGGGLAKSVEITDPELLKGFNPWIGQFADWQQAPLAEAPCFRRSFEVLFYLKWPGRESSLDRGDLNMIYATRYCSTGLVGYVYLPGPKEAHYGENTGTIIRGDADGKWHPATPGWDSLVRNAVAAQDPQGTPDMVLISGGELSRPIEVTDAGLLNQLDPWTGPFVDWERPVAGGKCGSEYEILYFKKGAGQPTPYDHDGMRMIYGFRYCLDEAGGPGYVHLSGRNDKFGPENVRVVWDSTHAGKWHPSTPFWNAFVVRQIASQKPANVARN